MFEDVPEGEGVIVEESAVEDGVVGDVKGLAEVVDVV